MRVCILLIILAVAMPAQALVSQKDEIVIRSAISSTDEYIRRMQRRAKPVEKKPAEPVGDTLPWLQKEAGEEDISEPVTEHPFEVMIRSQLALRQPSIVGLSRIEEGTAIMIVLSHVTELPLIQMQNYTPVDVLFIDASGEILQIMPEVVLNALKQEVQAYYPVKAFLYLKAGISVLKNIRPGDVVIHPLFNPKPTVLR